MSDLSTGVPALAAAPDPVGWAEEAQRELREGILPFWQARAPNPDTGGFYGVVGPDLDPRPGSPRGGLLTTRVLWTFSAASRRFGDEPYLTLARYAYQDLVRNFWDETHGGLYWTLTADGRPEETRKQIYLQAFGIYALSEYFLATGEPEALDRARTLYRLVETHAGDPQYGGYFEACTREWTLLDPAIPSVMGSPTPKSQNTHLHILEAYTNLLRAWPDPELRARQLALMEVMATRILHPQTGHLILFQDPDWTQRSDHVSFGHDIEAAWLLTEAAEVVGDEAWIHRAEQLAVALAERTLGEGIDTDGAVLNEAGPGGLTNDHKDWWPQAEAAVGFLEAYRISGDPRFLEASRRCWEFIQARLVDREHGGWFHSTDRAGQVQRRNRIDLWTCCYHSARCCLELERRLAALAPPGLALNDAGYLAMTGVNVMLASDDYPESHQGGVGVIHHGVRTATNGDLRLEPTPGQWQPVPAASDRVEDRALDEIRVAYRYPDERRNRTGFNPIDYPDLDLRYTVRVQPAGGSAFRILVDLDAPLPEAWVGRVGFNWELFPGVLFGKTYRLDDHVGIFPRQPSGPHAPLAEGDRLVVAPESDEQRMTISAVRGGPLQLLDGRTEHHNGWFVVRSLVPAGATKAAVEWRVEPHAIPGWRRPPVVQVSQVGYHPGQPKFAVVEMDADDSPQGEVALLRISEPGAPVTVLSRPAAPWGKFLRYHYLRFDFSDVTEPGMYRVQYRDSRSAPFMIHEAAYQRQVWQPTLETFLPVQMCHMRVNDRYRVWHDACHLDDARMAPLNHRHFDGYIQGASTLTDATPGQHVDGLNRGGWHDAGDYDLRVESQADTVHGLVLAYEEFGIDYDNTTIDQATRVVELFRPDGVPDLVQQIEHGVLTLAGGYQALGRFYRGIICPTLRQYTLLGDGAAMTDNRVFTPPADGEAPPVGQPGSPDDRWVFTEDNPRRALDAAAALAAAARVLDPHRPALAQTCREIALEVWDQSAGANPGPRCRLAAELLITTGESRYQTFLIEQAEVMARDLPAYAEVIGRTLPLIEDALYRETLEAAAHRYAPRLREEMNQTPYGLRYRPQIWGAGWQIQRFGVQQYFLHRAFPQLLPPDPVYNALNFVLGCHPGANPASFASAVGAESLTVAYGVNRADESHIPGGSASGTALIRPDFPELLSWPYLWQQTEYCVGHPTTDYLFLVLAVDHLLNPP